MTTDSALNALAREHPEWAPWLLMVHEILREVARPEWDAAVPPEAPAARPGVPLVADAAFTVPSIALDRLFNQVSRAASANMMSVQGVLDARDDRAGLLEASVRQDTERLASLAQSAGADVEAVQAVVALTSVPVLHACRRAWLRAVSPSWVEGYCPLCGSWPAFAEVRGIDQRRFFRCGRCGIEWYARLLRCPYCEMADHDHLVSLVPEPRDERAAIDACKRCSGYVKVVNTLQGCPPESVMIEDLSTVALDVAALEQGYTRPSGPGHTLQATVSATRATRRIFAWKS